LFGNTAIFDRLMPLISNVVIIHGLADVSKSWHRLTPLLEKNGFVPHYFEYPTLKKDLDVPHIVGQLEGFLDRNLSTNPFQIIAHSQGGLISEWFDFFRHRETLKRIVTIATPFQGNSFPLFAKSILERLPISRQQVKGLSCYSPVLKSLIHTRIMQSTHTEYFSFVGCVGKIWKIEGDLVVAVCEGNRNAIYYSESNFKPISVAPITPVRIMQKNHMPLNYIRDLMNPKNIFAAELIEALSGEKLQTGSEVEKLSQFALVLPVRLEKSIVWTDKIRKIISRKAFDEKYKLIFGEIAGVSANTLRMGTGEIRVRAGYFTYVLEA